MTESSTPKLIAVVRRFGRGRGSLAQWMAVGLLGVAIGLFIGWVVWPVNWDRDNASQISPRLQAEYLSAVADAFVASGGQTEESRQLARSRLAVFDDPGQAIGQAILYLERDELMARNIRQFNLRVLSAALGLDEDMAAAVNRGTLARSSPSGLWGTLLALMLLGLGIVGLLLSRRPDLLAELRRAWPGEQTPSPPGQPRNIAPAPSHAQQSAPGASPFTPVSHGVTLEMEPDLHQPGAPRSYSLPADPGHPPPRDSFPPQPPDQYPESDLLPEMDPEEPTFEEDEDAPFMASARPVVDPTRSVQEMWDTEDLEEDEEEEDEAGENEDDDWVGYEEEAELEEGEETDAQGAVEDEPTADSPPPAQGPASEESPTGRPAPPVPPPAQPKNEGLLSNIASTFRSRRGDQSAVVDEQVAHYQFGIADYDESYNVFGGKDLLASFGMGSHAALRSGQGIEAQVRTLSVWFYEADAQENQKQLLVVPGIDGQAISESAPSSATVNREPLPATPGQRFTLRSGTYLLECEVQEAEMNQETQPAHFHSVKVKLTLRKK